MPLEGELLHDLHESPRDMATDDGKGGLGDGRESRQMFPVKGMYEWSEMLGLRRRRSSKNAVTSVLCEEGAGVA
jgi:hypothetical protein